MEKMTRDRPDLDVGRPFLPPSSDTAPPCQQCPRTRSVVLLARSIWGLAVWEPAALVRAKLIKTNWHRPVRAHGAQTGMSALLLGLCVMGLCVMAFPGASGASSPVTSSNSMNVRAFMTLYGYADNSPPGTDIAHPCIHEQAGGTGTYQDPITFATDANELPWCTVIYVPYMERYFVHEDECSQCDQDWNDYHLYRFDMWAGGDSGSLRQPEHRALLRCESTWTRADSLTDPDNPTVIVDPPSDLPVVSTPIFSPPASCWQPISITNPGKQTTVAGTSVSLQISGTDTSPGRTLRYEASGLPAGLSIDSSSGVISGRPPSHERTRVTVTASDTYNSAGATFTWLVKKPTK
jgi:Putative Ig domain